MMQKERTTGKSWLNLNIQDSSSESEEDQESVIKNINQQKTNDNTACKSQQEHLNNLATPNRDAFRATKVSIGFFMNKNDNDIEEYDNFEVKQIRIQQSQYNQSIDQQDNYNDQKECGIIEEKEQEIQLPGREDEHDDNNNNQQRLKAVKLRQLNEQQQSNNSNRQRKMFQLQISDSQQSDLPSSQGQDNDYEEDNNRLEWKNRQNSSTLQLQQKDIEGNIFRQQQQHKQERQVAISVCNNSMSSNNDSSNSYKIAYNHKKDFVFFKQPQYHVLNEIHKDQRLRTIITRNTSGLNKLWPQFQVKLQSNGLNLLLIIKQTFTINCSYKLYSKLINSEKRYFGRIQSNLTKDFYKIFTTDNGIIQNLRAELYFTNTYAGSNQPRQFTVYMLTAESNFGQLVGQSLKQDMSLRQLFEFTNNPDKIRKFITRKPIYLEKTGGYMLNFNQRLKKGSIKNFILEDSKTQQQILMFGRLDKQSFKLQISHPLNSVIGAAIVMVQFQNRLME